MGTYDFLIFLIVCLVSVIILFVLNLSCKTWQEKICSIALILGITFYSGLGIAYETVDKNYVICFIIFLISTAIGLKIGFGVFPYKKENKYVERIDYLLERHSKILNLVFCIYWVLTIAMLFYPENRFLNLFNFEANIKTVFIVRENNRNDTLVYTINLIRMILIPFYYVWLQRRNSTIKVVILVLLQVYIDSVVDGYIGRSAALKTMLLVFFISAIMSRQKHKNDDFSQKNYEIKRMNLKLYKKIKKRLVMFAIVVLACIPVLYSYVYIRQGITVQNLSYMSAFCSLLESETSYPKWYDTTIQLNGLVISPLQYLYWLITLPIPKQFITFLPDTTILNYVFSEYATGILYGSANFTVALPSLLGEGFLIYGKYFYWIHGLVSGSVLGLCISFLQRFRTLNLYTSYVLTMVFVVARGGSQGTISSIINSGYILIIIYILACIAGRKQQKIINYKT